MPVRLWPHCGRFEMTFYGTDSNERRKISLILGALAVALAYFLNAILFPRFGTPPWWFDAPSVLGFYSLTYLAFDKVLWRIAARWKALSVPDLNGRWEGVLRSSHDEHAFERKVRVTIAQTWSRMTILLDARESTSESVLVGISTENRLNPRLIYEYLSKPRSSAKESMEIHEGTTVLDFDSRTEQLEGYYYTGRGRMNQGSITLRRRVEEWEGEP